MTEHFLNNTPSCLDSFLPESQSTLSLAEVLLNCLKNSLDASSGQIYLSDLTQKFKCIQKTCDYQPKTLQTPKLEAIAIDDNKQMTLPIELNNNLIGFIVLQHIDETRLHSVMDRISSVYNQLGPVFNLLQNKESMENELRLLNEHSIHFKTDSRHQIQHPSQGLIATLGFPKEELESKTLYELFPLKPGKTLTDKAEEISLTSKQGEEIWLEIQSKPIYDTLGNRAGNLFIQKDISKQKRVEEMAIKDELTQLFNRRFFNQVFPKEMDIARRNDSCVAFMIVDVDYFKQYNDTYGHSYGDEALRKVSSALQNCYRRRGDYVFRLGGEEFGVFCNITTASDAEMLASLTQQAIMKLDIEHKTSAHHVITASIGIYVGQGNDIPLDENDIFVAADQALYEAKNAGRNRVMVYGASDDIELT